MQKVNLAHTPHQSDVIAFTTAIVELAYADWRAGRKEYGRTGEELVASFTTNARGFHRRMASGIYNNALNTFACGDR